MSALCQFPQQSIQDATDFAFQLRERWNNRLRLPLTELTKRYIRDEVHVLVNIHSEFDGKRRGWIGCVEVANGIQLWTSQIENGKGQRQLPMLGLPVQIMDDPQHIAERIRSVIRLYSFDDLLCSVAREHLYFSFKTGRTIFVETLAKDGKLNLDGGISPTFWGREEPSHVIETRSEMMKNLSGENCESERNFPAVMVIRFLHEYLKTFITDDWVLAVLEKPGDFNLKINDVLVGPF